MCVYMYILFIRSVMSDSLWPHRLQYSRLSCTSLSSEVCSNVSIESVMPFNHLVLSHPLLLLPSIFPPASGSFPMSQFFASGGQNTRVSVSASVLPMYIQDWFPLGLTLCQESLQSQFKSFNSSVLSFLCGPTLTSTHDYWKNHSFD